MQQKQQDTLTGQQNAEETNRGSYLTNRERIDGTPFTMIREEQNWFMVMGDTRITLPTETREEQIKKLESEKWEIIMIVIIAAVNKLKEFENLTPEEKKEYEKPIAKGYQGKGTRL